MALHRTHLIAASVALASVGFSACAPKGPHIHVASATAAQLKAVAAEDTVWYEFREGDEVPFRFLVFGDAVSSGEPTKLVARRHFWIILSEGKELLISYDGESASTDQMEFMLSVVPTEDGRAQVVWLTHMGTGDPEEALKNLMQPAN